MNALITLKKMLKQQLEMPFFQEYFRFELGKDAARQLVKEVAQLEFVLTQRDDLLVALKNARDYVYQSAMDTNYEPIRNDLALIDAAIAKAEAKS